jgi:hypothetical protein
MLLITEISHAIPMDVVGLQGVCYECRVGVRATGYA